MQLAIEPEPPPMSTARPRQFDDIAAMVQPPNQRTPLILKEWEQALRKHPNQREVDFVLDTLRHGADVRFKGDRDKMIISPNLTTAEDNPEVIEAYLKEEVQLGRMAGPFDQPPIPNFRSSPLGAVPKDQTKFRIINHMSFPRTGQSVNSDIDKLECNLGSFDEAVKLVLQAGRGCKLVKIDVKSAFRLIPVRYEDINLLGIHWKDRYYLDTCLPFGMASSPPIWERFSRMIRWLIQSECLKAL